MDHLFIYFFFLSHIRLLKLNVSQVYELEKSSVCAVCHYISEIRFSNTSFLVYLYSCKFKICMENWSSPQVLGNASVWVGLVVVPICS